MFDAIVTRLRIGPGRALAAIALFAAVFAALDYATYPPPLPTYAAVRAQWQPSEAWLYDRHGRLIDSARVNFAARRLAWTPLADVSPAVRDTIVAAEDRRFGDHAGVDWLALAGSMRDRVAGRPRRGASTIPMQLAGYLSPDLAAPGMRGWRDKLRQMRAARRLAGQWSKDQMLEAYLNLAGFRGEAQGIGAVALSLFGKTPAVLTRDDALLLAGLLPQPQASPARVAARACALSRDADCARFTGAA